MSGGNPLASGAYIFGAVGLALDANERAFFRDADPWGFILFARNIAEADQIRRLTGDLRDAVGRDAPILIDQEGGRVQRLRPPLARDWPPPLDHAEKAGPAAEEALFARYRLIAAELRALGIDGNCAPSADIAFPDTHPFLKNRCYGSDSERVSRLAVAVSRGLRAGGVLPVLKHIPGHGRAEADSHHDLPVVRTNAETLRDTDFRAFRDVVRAPDAPDMAMTAHVVYGHLDDRPATTSPPLIRLIREEIGFDGLLMTDDLSMGALGGTPSDRARAAREAGCDVILHCNGDRAEMADVAEAAGPLSPEGADRAARALARRKAPSPIDIPALERNLCLSGTERQA